MILQNIQQISWVLDTVILFSVVVLEVKLTELILEIQNIEEIGLFMHLDRYKT